MLNRVPDYNHVVCDECGGIIGMRDRNFFKCDQCGKSFQLTSLIYDRLMINDVTGWIFPVINKKDEYDEDYGTDWRKENNNG